MTLVLVDPPDIPCTLVCKRCTSVWNYPPATRLYADNENLPITYYYCGPCGDLLTGKLRLDFEI